MTGPSETSFERAEIGHQRTLKGLVSKGKLLNKKGFDTFDSLDTRRRRDIRMR